MANTRNIYERTYNVEDLKDKPLSDYEPGELVAYLLKAYPGDPRGALKMLRENYDVGFVLGESTLILLEGLQSAKSNEVFGSIPKQVYN